MKTIYHSYEQMTPKNIDISYLEEWMNMKSFLPAERNVDLIRQIFGDEISFNEQIKLFHDKPDIYKILEEEYMEAFQDFEKKLEDPELRNFLAYLRQYPDGTVEALAWPFLFYISDRISPSYQRFIQVLVQLIAREVVSLSVKEHIRQMNEDPDYQLYKEAGSYQEYLLDKVLIPSFYQNFYQSCPQLLARCFEKTLRLKAYFDEVLEHISAHFNLSHVHDLSFAEGDTHGGSKTLVRFKVLETTYYYKPRNLEIEKFFHQTLDLFQIPYFKQAECIYEKDYSILEEVPQFPLESLEDAEDFYFDLGRLQLVLYLLGASDMHDDNLVAWGKVPVLIDLETLFHIHDDCLQVDGLVKERLLCQSKLLKQTGLLHLTIPGGAKGVEISGMFGKGEQSVMEREVLVHVNTMDMAIEKRPIDSHNQKNIPFTRSKGQVNPEKYSFCFYQGFKEAYQQFKRCRTHLMRLLASLPPTTLVRHVMRPTFQYADFHLYTSHPVYLANPLRYHKLLDNLLALEFSNYHINLAEIKDLAQDDIPIFFGEIGSVDLLDSRGQVIPRVWSKSPLEKVKRRIQQFNQHSMNHLLRDLLCNLQLDDRPVGPSKEEVCYYLEKGQTFFNTNLYHSKGTWSYDCLGEGMRDGVIGLWYIVCHYWCLEFSKQKAWETELREFLKSSPQSHFLAAFDLLLWYKNLDLEAYDRVLKEKASLLQLQREMANWVPIDVHDAYYQGIAQMEIDVLMAIDDVMEG